MLQDRDRKITVSSHSYDGNGRHALSTRVFMQSPASMPDSGRSGQALARADLKEVLPKGGAVPAIGSPEDLRRQMTDDYKRRGEVAKRIGLKKN